MRIDAHHHLWDLAVRDQAWTADLPTLRRSFSLDDLAPDLASNDVIGTVLVETVNVAAETPELLALAVRHRAVLGVVGWVELTAPGVADDIARLRELPGGEFLVGVRHQVQGEAEPTWLLRADVRRGLSAVSDAGLAYELLVTHDQLPAAIAAVAAGPEMTWVLDHAAKPPIATAVVEPWRQLITQLASHENVACKMSGLVTEARPDWTRASIAPYADHVLESFGAERVMFGSDWPVCLLRTGYGGVVDLTADLIASLTDAERADVWHATATRWYGLEAR